MLVINLINLAIAFLLFILALLFLLFYNHITLSAAIFILVAITPFLLICYGIYKMINKEIKKAINNLNTIAQTYEFENKKPSVDSVSSLQHLIFELAVLTQNLEKKDKQRRKYAAKLKLQNKQNTEVIEAIGHEFKNPIAAIMGYSQTLIEDTAIDKKLLIKFLDKIYQNANNMSLMIDRLALAAKLESDILKPNKTTFDLSELTETVISQLSIKYPRTEFKTNIAVGTLTADKTMMQLILTNLLDNASKYGGGSVEIKTKKDGNYTYVCVKDKGQGIAEDELKKLTQKFYRIRQNGWDNSLGLGLAIVDYLLKLHNSKLEISSQVGLGSEFGFVI